ncbi:MAG: Do family serine endopeptidase [Desulfobacteraceae bacterium]|jgi:Do/DeqQ family serine protease
MKFIHGSMLVLALLVAYAGAEASLRRSAVVIAVEEVSPAVVNISTVVQERVGPIFPFSRDDFFRDFFPDFFTREYTRTSLGSGVIMDGSKGYIITNHHVVARATEIKVITSEQKEYKGKVLGSDPRSDLAVLQIDVRQQLPEIGMGNSDDLMIGETVIAIGNPFGLSHTVTTGVVSALDRSVRTEERVYRHFIQTDASINPGNSGGPLLNIEGELIGINTAIYQKAQGIGFAIPINKAKRIVRELIREGRVRFPWLGIETQALTEELKGYFGLAEKSVGVLISDVIDGSPAAKAGMKRGDIILSLEDVPISSLPEYRDALGEYTAGDLLRLKIFRKGRELTVSAKPTPFPLNYAQKLLYRRVGIEMGQVDKRARKKYGLKEGVFVKYVKPDSKAAEYGLRAGDLLLKINNTPIKNIDTLNKAVSQYHHLPSITLIVQRGPIGYSLTLPF